MSISGSQEVKTAKIELRGSGGTERTGVIDAQEDREIVGYQAVARNQVISGADPTRQKCQLFIGRDEFIDDDPTLAGETNTQDNLSWMKAFHFIQDDDDVNGTGGYSEQVESEWFGQGSGVEWNEDVSLSFRGDLLFENAVVSVMVYYREL